MFTKKFNFVQNPLVEREYIRLRKQLELTVPQANTVAVVLHLFYPEMWEGDFRDRLKKLSELMEYDLIVNVQKTGLHIADSIKKDFPDAVVVATPNKGRDVLPFINIARVLRSLNYQAVLKLHSKKSPQRIDGSDWLNDMLDKLIPTQAITANDLQKILTKTSTGVIGPSGHYIALPVGEVSQKMNKRNVGKVIKRAVNMGAARRVDTSPWDYGFFEGTMFWIRLDSLSGLLETPARLFESEAGQTDGTLAHAIERCLCVVPEINNKKIYEINGQTIERIEYSTDNVPEWSEYYKGKRKKVTRDDWNPTN